MKRHERCPVFPTSVGHIPGLSEHNGLTRDDPMRDVLGQSWDILEAGVDYIDVWRIPEEVGHLRCARDCALD